MTSITALNHAGEASEELGMARNAAAEDRVMSSNRALGLQRRRHPRVQVSGKTRLVADTPQGMVTLQGNVTDLSVSGCAMRVFAPLEKDHEVRLELALDGERVWLPGRIMWTRTRGQAWIVGVQFEQLVPQKQSLLVRLVAERQRKLERY